MGPAILLGGLFPFRAPEYKPTWNPWRCCSTCSGRLPEAMDQVPWQDLHRSKLKLSLIDIDLSLSCLLIHGTKPWEIDRNGFIHTVPT
uniref:Uncharacterized protein n=1 Tax=Sphaerodactylus townsendi TaxID=933632 RepID=A0ACB8G0K3_9SAUR